MYYCLDGIIIFNSKAADIYAVKFYMTYQVSLTVFQIYEIPKIESHIIQSESPVSFPFLSVW